MSPIGKLFVVLNLVFSLVILGVLGGLLSKSENYRTLYTTEQTAHSTARTAWEQERSNKDAEIQRLKAQIAQLEGERDDLTARNEALGREKDTQSANNQQLRDDLSKLQASYDGFSTTLNELRTHNENLVKAKDDALAAKVEAEDARRAADEDKARLDAEVKSLQAKLQQLASQITELEAQKGDLTAQIEAAVQSGFDVAKIAAAPQIDGVVQHVNRDLKLVVLSIGGDDGVRKGTRFEIYGDGQYKGQVVVDDVFPDNSSARIVRGAEAIAVQDKATTRL